MEHTPSTTKWYNCSERQNSQKKSLEHFEELAFPSIQNLSRSTNCDFWELVLTIHRALWFAFSNEVRSQDMFYLIHACASTVQGRDLTWEHVKKNWYDFVTGAVGGLHSDLGRKFLKNSVVVTSSWCVVTSVWFYCVLQNFRAALFPSPLEDLTLWTRPPMWKSSSKLIPYVVISRLVVSNFT